MWIFISVFLSQELMDLNSLFVFIIYLFYFIVNNLHMLLKFRLASYLGCNENPNKKLCRSGPDNFKLLIINLNLVDK